MRNAIQEAFEAILPPEERARRLSGRQVDRYQLGEMLEDGAGGFGVVYRATHPEMGDAAVKVLTTDIEKDPRAYERFRREVKLLCWMDKAANVVDIRTAGVVDEMPWYAMELIHGQTLNHWLTERRSRGQAASTEQLLDILGGTLAGLSQVQDACAKKAKEELRRESAQSEVPDELVADRQGLARETARELLPSELPDCIVHRDLKPGNIMVVEGADGRLEAKLIDFGIAGLFRTGESSGTLLTQATLSAKTEEYASPEMTLRPESLDVRSDIFQVGLLAFDIMTGKRYWDCWPNSDSVLRESQGWPGWLKTAVLRALRWDRDERYETASRFHDQLVHRFRSVVSLSGIRRRTWQTIALMSWILLGLAFLFAASKEDYRRWSKNDPAAERARLDTIREIYDKLHGGAARQEDIEGLRDSCREFSALHSNSRFIRQVDNLRGWLDGYKDGRIRITPVQITNKGEHGNTVSYEVSCNDRTGKQDTFYVVAGGTRGSNSKDQAYFANDGFELRGDSPAEAEIRFGKKDDKNHESLRIHYTDKEIVTMPDNWPPAVVAGNDKEFQLKVRIERIGFGDLPKKP